MATTSRQDTTLADQLESFAGYHPAPLTGTIRTVFGHCSTPLGHTRCPAVIETPTVTYVCDCPCHRPPEWDGDDRCERCGEALPTCPGDLEVSTGICATCAGALLDEREAARYADEAEAADYCPRWAGCGCACHDGGACVWNCGTMAEPPADVTAEPCVYCNDSGEYHNALCWCPAGTALNERENGPFDAPADDVTAEYRARYEADGDAEPTFSEEA